MEQEERGEGWRRGVRRGLEERSQERAGWEEGQGKGGMEEKYFNILGFFLAQLLFWSRYHSLSLEVGLECVCVCVELHDHLQNMQCCGEVFYGLCMVRIPEGPN